MVHLQGSIRRVEYAIAPSSIVEALS